MITNSNPFNRPGRSAFLLGLLLFTGCSRDRENGDLKSKSVQDAQAADHQGLGRDSVGVIRAPSLGSLPAKVPPLVVSDWLKRHFAWYVPPQGEAPAHWSNLEKDIRPEACAKCHPAQYQDWKQSLHHKAMGSGVLGQLLDMELDEPILAISCQRCHAPLAEQIPYLERGKRNPVFMEGLREQGITCAACHVRDHKYFGPPPRRPGAENGGPHGGFEIRAEYQSPGFCASCHDFDGGEGMHGKLVQETAQEWRRTEFAAQGKTCQSCHMPDRRHLWKGVHDADMVRSAVSIQAQVLPIESVLDSLKATLSLTNVGAGHRLPTYIVPQIVLILVQADGAGDTIQGTRAEGIIARKVTAAMDVELFDTRLMPGEKFTLNYGRIPDPRAKTLIAKIEVWPDEAYRLYFKKMLETPGLRPKMPMVVAHLENAMKHDTDSRYLLWEKKFPL